MPLLARRYRLTNRRLVIAHGLRAVEGKAVALEGFDAIEIQGLPGQAALDAGDLVFRKDHQEVLRWAGVRRPEVLRVNCLKAREALLSVRALLERQAACA